MLTELWWPLLKARRILRQAFGYSSGDGADDDFEEEEIEWRGDLGCERVIGRRQ